jgi:signal transduction histidine kinase
MTAITVDSAGQSVSAPALSPARTGSSLAACGPSVETRRFSAGMRLLVALLCTLLLTASQPTWPLLSYAVLLGYGLWSAHVLFQMAAGRERPPALLCYWIDVGWSVATLHLFSGSTLLMTLTLVQPVVLASIGFGVRHGLALATVAALGLLTDRSGLMSGLSLGWRETMPALGVMALVPAAALLARPMSVLRWRIAMLGQLEAELDPRRGLEAVCVALVDRLRVATQAEVVAMVLPGNSGAPAVVSSTEEPGFRIADVVQRRLEALLLSVPQLCVVSHVQGRLGWLRGGTRVHGDAAAPPALRPAMDELARLLEAPRIVVLPLRRYDRRYGHLIVGHRASRGTSQDVEALTQAAPELVRLIEQAALVDQLQDESAAHERARIGRDLHDSAIQPYLGLKYAVECVALRIPADNPARAEVDALAELVNGEVSSLRELISGLRTGSENGDNALVPAVRRQTRRFALLFGVDVQLDCPDSLPTTRALAGALFHMVNEALNNIRKHTAARRIWISMSAIDGDFRLVVRDDAGTAGGAPVPDFRPTSLTERAAELGGTLTIDRPDGLNTELTITIPLWQ